jgi:hypothetical protein
MKPTPIDTRPRPKRKYIPIQVRVEVAERQFYAKASAVKLSHYHVHIQPKGTGGYRLQWLLNELLPPFNRRLDHRPPLQDRPINRKGDDYIPHQLDPDALEYINPSEHDLRTFGKREGQVKAHTTIGSDAWRRAKFNRLEGRTKKKPKRSWPKGRKIASRPFATREKTRRP